MLSSDQFGKQCFVNTYEHSLMYNKYEGIQIDYNAFININRKSNLKLLLLQCNYCLSAYSVLTPYLCLY